MRSLPTDLLDGLVQSDLFLFQGFLNSEMRWLTTGTGEGKALSNPHADIAQIQATFISPQVLFGNRACQQPFSKGKNEQN